MSTVLQILVTLKAADATALTAREAIQSLLGFGNELVALYRFRLVETTWSGREETAFDPQLEQYLDRSVEFWNPNRERCWARAQHDGATAMAWEVLAGKGTRPGPFGDPDLSESLLDHVLVTSLEPSVPAADFPQRLGGMVRTGYRSGEVFSTRWQTTGSPTERTQRLHRIAEVRSRHQGLLVHPEFQDHRTIAGPLPIPVWEAASVRE